MRRKLSTTQGMSFNDWMVRMIRPLRMTLGMHSDIDEDAFQDTYLEMATDPATPEESARRRMSFMAVYRRHSRRHVSEEFMTVRPDETFFLLLAADEDEERDPEAEEACDEMARRVKSYIRKTTGGTRMRIIDMRMRGFSIRDISAAFGIPSTRVEDVIGRVVTKARRRFAGMTLKNA